MPFNFADAKKLVRRTVHDTMAVRAFYMDDSMSVPAEIRARWHNKIDRFGDLESQGYAELIQGIDRVIVIPSDHPTVTFRETGVVSFPDYGTAFRLVTTDPPNGALEQVWMAAAV